MLARTRGLREGYTGGPAFNSIKTGRFVGPVKLYSLLPHGHYFVMRP